MNINGYYLNKHYTNVVALIKDMMGKAILARTTLEAKTILRLMRYIGVNYLMYDTPMSEYPELNIPHRGLKNHLYHVQLYNNELVVIATPVTYRHHALISYPIVLVREIVVKKSILATIRDLF